MSTTLVESDLNNTIASAVSARVEAEVMAALSGDAVIGQYVTAALNQPVSVKRGYREEQVPFIKHTLDTAIREATKAAVQRTIQEELPAIEAEVKKALRRNLTGIAESLTKSLSDAAEKTYGVSVDLTLKMPGE